MDTRSASVIIESNLLWHRSEGGDREALVRGLGYWKYADLMRLHHLLGEEMMDRTKARVDVPRSYDELELWLGEGQ